MPCIIDMREKGGPRQQRKAFDVWTPKPLRAGGDEIFQVATANRADTRRMPPVTAILEGGRHGAGQAAADRRADLQASAQRTRLWRGPDGGGGLCPDSLGVAAQDFPHPPGQCCWRLLRLGSVEMSGPYRGQTSSCRQTIPMWIQASQSAAATASAPAGSFIGQAGSVAARHTASATSIDLVTGPECCRICATAAFV